MRLSRAAGRLAIGLALVARAAGAPENTAVVVNADSWASTFIANEYVRLRGIPPWNVVYLSDLTSFEAIGVEEFRQKILLPILQTLEGRGLATQIDAVLYSADFPTMIDCNADVGQQKLPPALTPYGSITGLTFLYQPVQAKSATALDLASNFYVRRAAMPVEDAAWTNDDREKYLRTVAQMQEAGRQAAALRTKPDAAGADALREKMKEAIAAFNQLKERHPNAAELAYNLGCALALAGRPEEAVRSLQRAADTGWWEVRNAALDEDLTPLRGRPDFEKFLARTRELRFEPQRAMAFRGAIGWLNSGQPTKPEEGRRYLISTMLGCTSGQANSVREVLAGLRRSASADSTMPRGTVYFMKTGDVRSTTREWGFDSAAEKLRDLGVKAAVESGVVPDAKSDVMGVMTGAANFAWDPAKSRILPGAICENLTSFGGAMYHSGGQTTLAEFIRHGAAGASGTVSEPFALQAKFPTPFIHLFYAQGCTLGEAFYQSLSGPYQLLIVGDALCKPWGRRIVVKPGDLKSGDTLKGIVKIVPRATSPDRVAAEIFEMYVDGKRGYITKNGGGFEWDTRTAPDGAHEIAIVASASDSVASQGRVLVPVEIRNSDEVLKVSAPGGRERAWDKPFDVTASLPGAKEILVMSNMRILGRIAGESGTATLDPRVLGQGPARLMIVALREGAGPRQVIAKPVEFTVVPPAPLPSLALPAGKILADDFQIRVAGRGQSPVKEAIGDWLAKAGVDKDAAFSVEGWFSVPEDDVYQFQLRGNVGIESLSVDGVRQDWPRGKEWWFVPVHLAKGLHRLNFSAKGVAQPLLEFRFGGPGAQGLEGRRFRHPASPAAQ